MTSAEFEVRRVAAEDTVAALTAAGRVGWRVLRLWRANQQGRVSETFRLFVGSVFVDEIIAEKGVGAERVRAGDENDCTGLMRKETTDQHDRNASTNTKLCMCDGRDEQRKFWDTTADDGWGVLARVSVPRKSSNKCWAERQSSGMLTKTKLKDRNEPEGGDWQRDASKCEMGRARSGNRRRAWWGGAKSGFWGGTDLGIYMHLLLVVHSQS